MSNKIEILAPAGSFESVVAGVRCGANAVYLGSKEFNARRNADNFDDIELKKAVEYCHQRDVKVYLTLNILVSDSEMRLAYNTVDKAMAAGIDAFIVQDLGLAKMIKEHFPDAQLHASTQCSVNTPQGFRVLEDLGFKRAVLPRELSIDEIKEIRSETNIELEMFVHGALCMCVSGQCYLSSMLGSRSGNRGLCAQPCRLRFSADGTDSHDLSLKDLSLIEHMDEIRDLGIASLKIEGRMKRPEYVASAVTSCKKALNGIYGKNDSLTLKSIFSRTGFTDGYFTGKRENMFGFRQKDDVVSAKEVIKDLSHLYDNETPLLPIELHFVCKHNQKAALTAVAQGKTVTITGPVPEKAINKPMTKESLNIRLSKFGNTQFYLKNITFDLDSGLIISASEINSMRRHAVEELTKTQTKCYIKKPFSTKVKTKVRKSSEHYYTARFSDPNTIPDAHPFKRIFIPVWSSDEDFVDNRAGVEIPRGLFSQEQKLKKRLQHLKKTGVKRALCSNLGAYKLCEALGFEVFGDFGLNVFNSQTAGMFHSPILSFEASLETLNKISAEDTGMIAYGKLPLMLTRNCPIKNHVGCQNCSGKITDRKGYDFSVKCSPYPCVEIFNPIPVYMADRQNEIKTDFLHFYFTDESKSEVEKIINDYQTCTHNVDKYTRGLYYRGVI